MIPLVSALLLAAAPPAPDLAEPEQRRMVGEILGQLLAEDEDVHHFRDHRGHDRIWIKSRPRGEERGLCRRDVLEIERDPKAENGGVREIDVKRLFYVVTDQRDRPLWSLYGDPLERRCKLGGLSGPRWFQAEHGFDARMAVAALIALKARLLVPDPPPGLWTCRSARQCPDSRAVLKRVDPLNPGPVTSSESGPERCPDEMWCVSVELADPDCGSWVTQLRLDPRDDYRLRSARVVSFAGALECGERELFDAGGG